MTIQQQDNLNENKIAEILQLLEQDRNKFFTDIKNSKSYDKIKEQKLKNIENLQRNLIFYKQILIKENENK